MKSKTLTEGSVIKKIIFFALPLLGSSLIQQLYTTVDLVFVGRFLGTEAAAAVGAGSLIITCLVGFFNGMAVGTSVFTAQYFGGKRWENLHKLIQTIFLVGIVGGLILMTAGIIGAPFFLEKMGTPSAIMNQAVVYMRVYMTGMLSIVLYNLLSGVIRALGDSRNPMLFQFVGGIINIAGDYFCIAVLKMGVEGTAIATVVSQTVAAICAVIYLCRMKNEYALRPVNVLFDKKELGKVLKVGVPAGVQSIVITLSNILIQSQINTLGVSSIAAFTIYFRTEMILYLPILALGQTVVSFVGQNFGAKKFNRIRQGNYICIGGGAVFTLMFALLILSQAPILLRIFTDDAEVIRLGVQIMKVTFPLYFFCTILECISGNLRGYGKAMAPMVVIIISYCGFRIAFLFMAMSIAPSVSSVAFSYPVSWGIAMILMLIVSVVSKKKREVDETKTFTKV